ncbi:glycosyltransferase family 2 protein [uncultured Brevundimonas sp.]|uniref:glycosyltransferase family 2 protein n=1 Tax=uncultured Brevundimonas sp. TaxID=213418 RepID=UPI0025F28A38|nr:glycosyltransferase family 2 protein [uncultured Brevundimonas sp.]
MGLAVAKGWTHPGVAPRSSGAWRRAPSGFQVLAWTMIVGGYAFAVVRWPGAAFLTGLVMVQAAFVVSALWKAVIVLASMGRPRPAPRPIEWPRYTILAALHDEAAVAPELIANLARIDYPAHRLEAFIVLEAHDAATLAAVQAAPKPSWLKTLIVPPGQPLTKPRALNHALAQARGDLITIYDAEDRPHPQQLRQAAARFVAQPRLGCLQAPLRIRPSSRTGSTFLDRQFAFEYAALFEVTLPGMARLGLPFPLGGTSNHIRMTALRAAGGWDAHNVTEDADLGFRLWSMGWKLDVIDRPTWETPPGGLDRWLPRRTRWLKGYMQTWGVHTRRPRRLGRRGLLSLIMTLGTAILAASAHAPALAWLASAVLAGLHAGIAPATPLASMAVLATGVIASWIGCAVGARRAGLTYRLGDMLAAPAYWSLLSLAFVHAAWRLIVEPHVWDKTPHDGEAQPLELVVIADDAGREAA